MQPGVPPTLVFITVIFGASVFTPSLPPPGASQGNLPQYRCSKAAKHHCSLCSFPSSSGAIPPHPGQPRQPVTPQQAGSRGAATALPAVPAVPTVPVVPWPGWQQQEGGGQAPAQAVGMVVGPVTQGHLSQSCRTPTSSRVAVGTTGSMTSAGAAGAGTPRGCRESWHPAPALLAAHPPRAISSAEGAGKCTPSLLNSPLCSWQETQHKPVLAGPSTVNGAR